MIHNCIRLLSIIIRSVENKYLNLIHASLDVQWWDTHNIVNIWLFYVFEFCLWQLYFILEDLLLVFFMFSVVCCYTSGMNLTQGAKSRIQKGHSLCYGYLKLNCTENGKFIKNVTSKTSLVEEDIQTELPIKLPIVLVGI